MKHEHKQLVLALVATLSTLATAAVLSAAHPPKGSSDGEVEFSFARIYWEYNASANDLGVHVTLDGEDWKYLRITNPLNKTIFGVVGKGPYKELGMTELFFEGAEPSLEEVPLEELLAKFPEGVYEFEGQTVGGEEIEADADFSHAIPDGPEVFSSVAPGGFVEISWNPVVSGPPGFPVQSVDVVSYQVIVESFEVTVPASVLSMTVPPEFVLSLPAGTHQFEVLAIEASGNQTLTEGEFVL
mgnify:CR=1 FL=1